MSDEFNGNSAGESVLSRFLAQMPIASQVAYFDHAAVAPLPGCARKAIENWLVEATEEGDVAWQRWARRMEEVRSCAARLINAEPAEIALVPNTTFGINLVAEGFPWRDGDNVVTLANEFPSNQYPWMNQHSRGVEVRRVPVEGGVVDLERLAGACDERTRIVSVSWVGFATGWRVDVAAVADICRRQGALFFLDAIQGLGVFSAGCALRGRRFSGGRRAQVAAGAGGGGDFFRAARTFADAAAADGRLEQRAARERLHEDRFGFALYRFGGGGEGAERCIDHHWLVELGSRGVDLFFVLSGFLITGILFDAKGKQHYFRNFYMRRSLRIFPLYYAAIILAVFVLPLLSAAWASDIRPAAEHQAWLWLYGANAWQSLQGQWNLGPLNHFWSLAIEEHFYLVWPAVIYCASRRTALRVCGLLFCASVAGRAAWLASGGNDVAALVLTPLRMDGLVLGSWLALVARADGGLSWLRSRAAPALVIAGSLALAADALGRRLFGLPIACWALACGALLILTIASRKGSFLATLGGSRTLQFFGKYSYAMYVIQLPLIYLAAPIFTAASIANVCGSALGQAMYCGIMFMATTLLALGSWYAFESRLLTLKHRFGH